MQKTTRTSSNNQDLRLWGHIPVLFTNADEQGKRLHRFLCPSFNCRFPVFHIHACLVRERWLHGLWIQSPSRRIPLGWGDHTQYDRLHSRPHPELVSKGIVALKFSPISTLRRCLLQSSSHPIGGKGHIVELLETLHTEDVSAKHRSRRERRFSMRLVLICWNTNEIVTVELPDRQVRCCSAQLLEKSIRRSFSFFRTHSSKQWRSTSGKVQQWLCGTYSWNASVKKKK